MRTRRHRGSRDGVETALANFALTFAKALLVFCVAMFILISPKVEDGTKPKAEYLINVEWAGDGANDVDTWVRTPDGSRVSFMHREANVVFLERDDRGNDCAATTTNAIAVNICQEITVIRGVAIGEYVVALHLYSHNRSSNPFPLETPIRIKVTIEKLNPTTQIVWHRVVTLSRVREELPLVRFTIGEDGRLTQFETDDLPAIIYHQESP